MPRISRRQFVRRTLTGVGLCGSIGCGTVLYPERRGQPAGPLDWGIVALDAVGLLLFFVPGVIAFAVDFSNGTIYLPPERYSRKPSARGAASLIAVQCPQRRLAISDLEEIVSQHAQREVLLVPGSYRTQELASLDEYWDAADKFAGV